MSEQRSIGPVTGATASAAAVTTILFWVLSTLGIEAPNEVQGAVTVLIVVIAGWLVPAKNDPNKHVAE